VRLKRAIFDHGQCCLTSRLHSAHEPHISSDLLPPLERFDGTGDERAAEAADEEESELDAAGGERLFRADAVAAPDAGIECPKDAAPEAACSGSASLAEDKFDSDSCSASPISSLTARCSSGLICISNTWQRLMVGPHIDLSELRSNGRMQGIDDLVVTPRAAMYTDIRSEVSSSCSCQMELELDDDNDETEAEDAEDKALETHPPCSLSTWSWRALHLHCTKIVKELRTLPLTEFTTGC
jgi:hypothetical protein